eukprot:TRINITY_DN1373_c1_g1_i3.p1 TRINITY_DN1373_c1_g1~~TRINITY_DN1373_c1_g1_i3.p1  ORF type:complete len:815 (-),score=195.80 TRINITY_DN1373_c1_g1_i3:57-2501(-)
MNLNLLLNPSGSSLEAIPTRGTAAHADGLSGSRANDVAAAASGQRHSALPPLPGHSTSDNNNNGEDDDMHDITNNDQQFTRRVRRTLSLPPLTTTQGPATSSHFGSSSSDYTPHHQPPQLHFLPSTATPGRLPSLTLQVPFQPSTATTPLSGPMRTSAAPNNISTYNNNNNNDTTDTTHHSQSAKGKKSRSLIERGQVPLHRNAEHGAPGPASSATHSSSEGGRPFLSYGRAGGVRGGSSLTTLEEGKPWNGFQQSQSPSQHQHQQQQQQPQHSLHFGASSGGMMPVSTVPTRSQLASLSPYSSHPTSPGDTPPSTPIYAPSSPRSSLPTSPATSTTLSTALRSSYPSAFTPVMPLSNRNLSNNNNNNPSAGHRRYHSFGTNDHQQHRNNNNTLLNSSPPSSSPPSTPRLSSPSPPDTHRPQGLEVSLPFASLSLTSPPSTPTPTSTLTMRESGEKAPPITTAVASTTSTTTPAHALAGRIGGRVAYRTPPTPKLKVTTAPSFDDLPWQQHVGTASAPPSASSRLEVAKQQRRTVFNKKGGSDILDDTTHRYRDIVTSYDLSQGKRKRNEAQPPTALAPAKKKAGSLITQTEQQQGRHQQSTTMCVDDSDFDSEKEEEEEEEGEGEGSGMGSGRGYGYHASVAAMIANHTPCIRTDTGPRLAVPLEIDDKRQRATPEQIELLEKVFGVTPLPTAQTKAELSQRTGMSQRRIQVWFQNKRARLKRMGIVSKNKDPFVFHHLSMAGDEGSDIGAASSYYTDALQFPDTTTQSSARPSAAGTRLSGGPQGQYQQPQASHVPRQDQPTAPPGTGHRPW